MLIWRFYSRHAALVCPCRSFTHRLPHATIWQKNGTHRIECSILFGLYSDGFHVSCATQSHSLYRPSHVRLDERSSDASITDLRNNWQHYPLESDPFIITKISICVSQISECSSPRIRGTLSSFTASALALGILVAYIIGAFVDWWILAFILSMFPMMLFTGMIFMPETPIWLISHNREDDAKKALQRLRGKYVHPFVVLPVPINSPDWF